MKVELIELELLRREAGELSRESFVERRPGTFLLAMGYLEVEQIQSRTRASHDLTSAVSFGSQRRHQAGQAHPLAGLAFLLGQGGEPSATVGRSTQCHITIPDESVSDIHCKLELLDDVVHVVDVGSTNGTSINLRQLELGVAQAVADQDILSMGRYSFQVLRAKTLHDELSLLAAMDAFENGENDGEPEAE